MSLTRKIIHVDMDCFYAAVEMRDNPALKSVPLAVGGASDRRGVVATCNYIAREYGVHSAMATGYAQKLCPGLVVIPGRMKLYQQISRQIREIFHRYTDLVEPLSLDEAYLDVSDSHLFGGSATLTATDIRSCIKNELQLTASAGIAPNKFIAKICSDENKPDGQFVVTPDEVDDFVKHLALTKIPGVGKATLKRLESHQLYTCSDVRYWDQTKLHHTFGSFGELLYRRSWGIDDRPVRTEWIRKSLSVERTFPKDIMSLQACEPLLVQLFDELEQRLARNAADRLIKNQVVKLKFSDFKSTTIERRASSLSMELFRELLPLAWIRGSDLGIRLLGLGVNFIDGDQEIEQLSLFD
jgi:DNA polymerase-4